MDGGGGNGGRAAGPVGIYRVGKDQRRQPPRRGEASGGGRVFVCVFNFVGELLISAAVPVLMCDE